MDVVLRPSPRAQEVTASIRSGRAEAARSTRARSRRNCSAASDSGAARVAGVASSGWGKAPRVSAGTDMCVAPLSSALGAGAARSDAGDGGEHGHAERARVLRTAQRGVEVLGGGGAEQARAEGGAERDEQELQAIGAGR